MKETLTRIMSKGRRYQAQLEERKLLHQLIEGMRTGQQDSLRRFNILQKVRASMLLSKLQV